jgi:hypothetical protein
LLFWDLTIKRKGGFYLSSLGHKIDMNMKNCKSVCGMMAVLVSILVVIPAAEVADVQAIGFGFAGSSAATLMSGEAVVGEGTVVLGSTVAILQTIGAIGLYAVPILALSLAVVIVMITITLLLNLTTEIVSEKKTVTLLEWGRFSQANLSSTDLGRF